MFKLQFSDLPKMLDGISPGRLLSGRKTAIILLLIFTTVLIGLPAYLPVQFASWFTFLALLIMPGYLLCDLVTRHLNLDWFERLALSFPLGIIVLIPAGMTTLLLHLNASQLLFGWILSAGLLIIIWLYFQSRLKTLTEHQSAPWAWNEIILLLLLIGMFVIMLPTLTSYKIDGDSYTFIAFISEALTNQPINETEPLFGTDLGPGVRLLFNQFTPLWILWSKLSQIDPITLTALTARSMFALWALLASYTLGKAAGNGNRRFGLVTAIVLALIYLIAPFLRRDNVSIFFFERTNADKFTVSITMLPLVFALAIYFLRHGRWRLWITAALVALAVSTIHPLIAAMMALALTAFGGLHLLLNWRQRLVWMRVTMLGALVAVTMFLPLVQLVISRGGEPLAPTYPASFDNWPIAKEIMPTLPFLQIEGYDVYGPLPDLATLDADQAETDANPFLIWRFALNMRRQRLIVFDLNRYISDPSLILEPPYLIALLLTPLLFWRLRSHIGAQFVVASNLAIVFVMYNPFVTPLVGSFVVPWILWRFVWLLPYALTIVLAGYQVGSFIKERWPRQDPGQTAWMRFAPILLLVGILLLFRQNIANNLATLNNQEIGPWVFPTPERLFAHLNSATVDGEPIMVAADQALSVPLGAYVPNANIIAHRHFNISEIFPAYDQDIALQRLIDQHQLFDISLLTPNIVDIFHRYDFRYVAAATGSELDYQLQLYPQWFRWELNDQNYNLYFVKKLPELTGTIHGNQFRLEQEEEKAMARYEAAWQQDPTNVAAPVGIAEIYRDQGKFDLAEEWLLRALDRSDLPILHYQLGQLYLETGQPERAITRYEIAHQDDTAVSHFHLAHGRACLQLGNIQCAETQFETAVAALNLSDRAAQLLALGEIWDQHGDSDRALALYEQSVALKPSRRSQFTLAYAYQNASMFTEAEKVLAKMQEADPLSAQILFRQAQLYTSQARIDEAAALYQQAIQLQEWQSKDTTLTRLSFARTLLRHNRLEEAGEQIQALLHIQPNNALAHLLLGDWYQNQLKPEEAIASFKKAITLDPTDANAYLSLSDEYDRQAAIDQSTELLKNATNIDHVQAGLFFISLGDRLHALGDVPAAVDAYLQALESLNTQSALPRARPEAINHRRALIYARLADLYADQSQPETAVTYYKAAAAAAPTEAWNRVLLGNMLRQRRDMRGAEASYRQVISIDPTYIDAYVRLAELLRAQGDMSEAEQVVQQGLEALAENSIPRASLLAAPDLMGLYHQSLSGEPRLGSGLDFDALNGEERDIAAAIMEEIFADVIQELETDEGLTAVQALARYHLENDQPHLALAQYQQRLEAEAAERNSPVILSRYYKGIGDIHLGQGQLEDARIAYQQAIDLDRWWPGPRLGLGQVLAAQENLSAAIEQYEEGLMLAPNSVEIQLALADALEQQGENEAAFSLLQKVAAMHPGNTNANLALAAAWQEQGRWSEAEEIYKQVITLAPGAPEGYIGLANLYLAQSRYEAAETKLRDALQIDRTHSPTYLSLGNLLTRLGRNHEAIAAYEAAVRYDPNNWRIYAGLADNYLIMEQTEIGLAYLQRAVQGNVTEPDPFLSLAALYRQQNEIELAEDTLKQGLSSFPKEPTLRFALADHYQSSGKGDDALTQLALATETNPQSLEALARYGIGLYLNGRAAQAQNLFQTAIQTGTPSTRGYRTLAAGYELQGKNLEALEWIDMALALAPNDDTLWQQRGQLLAQTGDNEGALAAFEQATTLNPSQGNAWWQLGETLLAANRTAEAVTALETAVNSSPPAYLAYGPLIQAYTLLGQNETAEQQLASLASLNTHTYLEDLALATVLQEHLRWQEAETAVARAITRAPGIANTHLALADLMSLQGKYQEAISAYQQAVSIESGNWQAYVGLANVYKALGETAKAEENLNKALTLSAPGIEPFLALSTLHLEQTQPELAEAKLQQGLEQFPNAAVLRYRLAELYKVHGRYQEALTQFSLAVAAHPDSMESLVRYGNELFLQARHDEAIRIYQQAENAGEKTPAGYRLLAAAYESQGDFDRAAALLRQALELAANDPETWIQLARVQGQQEKEAEMRASLEYATQIDPYQASPWTALAVFLLDAGENEGALAALQRAVTVEPTFLPAVEQLIQVHQNLNQPDQADQVIASARERMPGSYVVDLYAARLSADRQLWSEAQASLEQALMKAPGVAAPLIARAQLELDRGQADQALIWLEQALSRQPGNSIANTLLGDTLLRQGENEEALVRIEQALAGQPGDYELLLRHGRVQRSLGQFSEAEATLQQAATLNRGDASVYAELGQLYLLTADFDSAITAYEQAITLAPTQETHYLALDQIYIRLAQPEQALAVLNNGLSKLPQSSSLVVAKANHFLRAGEADSARIELESALANLEEIPELLNTLMEIYLFENAPAEAEQVWMHMLEQFPHEAASHIARATYLSALGRSSEALSHYEIAAELRPNSADVHLQLADAYADDGRLTEAQSIYEDVLALDATMVSAYVNMAATLQRSGQSEAARQVFEDGLQAVPTSQILLREYSAYLLSQGEQEQALALLNEAILISPVAETLVARANVLQAMGQWSEAEADLRQAIESEPGSFNAQLALGNMLRTRGFISEAIDHYQAAIELDARRVDGYLALAALYMSEDMYSSAINNYQAVLRQTPYETSVWLQLGQAQFAQGSYEEALTSIEGALNLDPNRADAWVELGNVLSANGEAEAAQAAFEQALAINPDEAEALIPLATIFSGQGELSEAEQFAQTAVESSPTNSQGYAALATVLSNQGETEEAAAHYLTAVQLNPRLINAYKSWIRLHLDTSQGRTFIVNTDRLQAALDEIIATFGVDELWTHTLAGLSYLEIEGPTSRALSHLESAITLEPEFLGLYQELALAYEQQLNGRKALENWAQYQTRAQALNIDTSLATEHINWLEQAVIRQPEPLATLSGQVIINGTATAGEEFQFYKLEYTPAGAAETWTTIGEVKTVPQADGQLAVWDTTSLPPGDYRLRLTVVDNTYNDKFRYEIEVKLDQTAGE